MSYDDYFKAQVLKDFGLDVGEYIDTIYDVDDFINTLRPSYIKVITEPKKVITILNNEKQKYKVMCDNPTALTFEDRQKIKEILEYCKSQGSLNPDIREIRKKRTEEVIKEYKTIALKNRMFMLANQAEIDAEIDKLILSYEKKKELKREAYVIKRIQDIRDWQCQSYQCCCGLQIQRVNKARHEKTKSHQEYIKAINPNAELPKNTYEWHKEKYTCECGRVVSKGNKYAHENTKYHKQYCNQTTKPKKKYDLIIEDDDSVENIVLTIGEKNEMREKCVADNGNSENEPDDEAFKYF